MLNERFNNGNTVAVIHSELKKLRMQELLLRCISQGALELRKRSLVARRLVVGESNLRSSA
ncbi:hypothetical protein Scep_011559 [Stephania cephalantha]|uniref:Uncharacterized protein n=1 Tax=Stephania cephalantha TaxID=152367 RepID=A0AAP0JF14_9MAGN